MLLLLALLSFPGPAMGEGQEIHGEDSVFAAQGVAIVWAVLKAAAEDRSEVILRIVPRGSSYAYASVEAVDPFTRIRQTVLEGRPLDAGLEVRSLRAGFADYPRREIHLFRTPEAWRARSPDVTVFYLGIPDTTPEFLSEDAVLRYLTAALARVQGAGQGLRP
jgi:hypothetical protein